MRPGFSDPSMSLDYGFVDSKLTQKLDVRMTCVSRSGSPLKCYSDTATWWRYIDCDTVRGYLSCYTRSDRGMS